MTDTQGSKGLDLKIIAGIVIVEIMIASISGYIFMRDDESSEFLIPLSKVGQYGG